MLGKRGHQTTELDDELVLNAEAALEVSDFTLCLNLLTKFFAKNPPDSAEKTRAVALKLQLQEKLAESLFNLNAQLFTSLDVEEFQTLTASMKNRESHIIKLTTHGNHINQYVIQDIFSCDTEEEMLTKIRFWFEMMVRTKEKGDFIAHSEIYACLSGAFLPIMAYVEKALSPQQNGYLEAERTLHMASGQYSTLREAMEAHPGPTLVDITPYINQINIKLAGIQNYSLQLKDKIDGGTPEESDKARAELVVLMQKKQVAINEIFNKFKPKIDEIFALAIPPKTETEAKLGDLLASAEELNEDLALSSANFMLQSPLREAIENLELRQLLTTHRILFNPERIAELDRILQSSKTHPRDPDQWVNISYLIDLFEAVGIDPTNPDAHLILENYHRSSPRAIKTETVTLSHDSDLEHDKESLLAALDNPALIEIGLTGLLPNPQPSHRFQKQYESAIHQQAIYLKQFQERLFSQIPIEEIQQGRGPHISSFINPFNRLSNHIITDIIKEKDQQKRALRIIYWIKLLEASCDIGDFATGAAINSALKNSALWNMPTFKKILAEHEDIRHFMDTVANKFKGSKQEFELSLCAEPSKVFFIGPYFTVIDSTLVGITDHSSKNYRPILTALEEMPAPTSWKASTEEPPADFKTDPLINEIEGTSHLSQERARELILSLSRQQAFALKTALDKSDEKLEQMFLALSQAQEGMIHTNLLSAIKPEIQRFIRTAIISEKTLDDASITQFIDVMLKFVGPRSERYQNIMGMLQTAQHNIDTTSHVPPPLTALPLRLSDAQLSKEESIEILTIFHDQHGVVIAERDNLNFLPIEALETILQQQVLATPPETLVNIYKTLLSKPLLPPLEGDEEYKQFLDRLSVFKRYVDDLLLGEYYKNQSKANRKKYEFFDQKANAEYDSRLYAIAKDRVMDTEKELEQLKLPQALTVNQLLFPNQERISEQGKGELKQLIDKIPSTKTFQSTLSTIFNVPVSIDQAKEIKQASLRGKIENEVLRNLVVSQNLTLKYHRLPDLSSESAMGKVQAIKKALNARFKSTSEYVEEINRVLRDAQGHPRNPTKWVHVSYLMLLFETVGIDPNNPEIRQYLAHYHKANPDTVPTQPAKYKPATRVESKDKSHEGVAKSGHEVKRASKAYPSKPGKAKKDIFAKTNEMQQAEFESAMGEIYGLLLEDGAPKSRVVVDETGLVIGSYSVGVPLKDFNKMSRAELKTEKLAETRIAGNAVAKYFLAEDDWHQENLDSSYVIDHDMSLWPVAIKYKGDVRGKPPVFTLSGRDIESFPDIKDSQPHYWPTKPELKSHPTKGFFWSRHGRYIASQFSALKDNEKFNRDKYYFFMKFTLITDQMLDEAVDGHVSSLTMRDEIKTCVKDRRDTLRNTLLDVRAFRKTFLEAANDYLSRLMQDAEKYNQQFHGKEKYHSKMVGLEERKQAFLAFLEATAQRESTQLTNELQSLTQQINRSLKKNPTSLDIETTRLIKLAAQIIDTPDWSSQAISDRYFMTFGLNPSQEELESSAYREKFKWQILSEVTHQLETKQKRLSSFLLVTLDRVKAFFAPKPLTTPPVEAEMRVIKRSPLDSLFAPEIKTKLQATAWGRCLNATKVIEQAETFHQALLQTEPTLILTTNLKNEIQQQLRMIEIEILALSNFLHHSKKSLGAVKKEIIKRLDALESLKKKFSMVTASLCEKSEVDSQSLSVASVSPGHQASRSHANADEERYIVELPAHAIKTTVEKPILKFSKERIIYENPESADKNPEREKIAYHALAKAAAKQFSHCSVLKVTSGTGSGRLTRTQAKYAAGKIAKYLALEAPDKLILIDGKPYNTKNDWRSRFFGGSVVKRRKAYIAESKLIRVSNPDLPEKQHHGAKHKM